MVMTAGPEQVDSSYHEAWVPGGITFIQTAQIGPAQKWYPHLQLEFKRNWQVIITPLIQEHNHQFIAEMKIALDDRSQEIALEKCAITLTHF